LLARSMQSMRSFFVILEEARKLLFAVRFEVFSTSFLKFNWRFLWPPICHGRSYLCTQAAE
jgi:hypothetical protein